MLRNAFAALCTETTLLALKTVADAMESVVTSIHTKVADIQTAAESTNSKIIACNTGDVWVSNLPDVQPVSGPLTNAELRLHDVQVSLGGESVIVGNWPSVQSVSGFVEIANDSGNPIPVTGGITNTELRAADIKVTLDGEQVTLSNPGLTDTQLRASDVKVSLDGEQITVANFPVTQTVSGTVEITNDAGNAIPVSIASVPSHAVTGPLTNTELRASDVKVSLDGEQVAVSNFPATQAVSGTVTVANPGLTDAQLRASAVPVSSWRRASGR